MVSEAAAQRPAKAERTRAAILAAGEGAFARRGYAATRLEDVADAVGVKRAALFYYFRDKQALYDAVIEEAFRELVARLEAALSGAGPIAPRVEAAVETWVDAIEARPALARLILRHAADAEERPATPLFPAAERLLRMAWALFEEGRRRGELEPLHDDPFHAASALIGATVFYVSALAPLLPLGGFDPLAPEQMAAHKRDALRTARRLLGIRAPRPMRRRTSR
ncbi:MAG TPA: helix-turn-helix domain-containing protein [Myxococcota bacterium]|nr:helix-turn-helix domain-containing protein [Myxococcota bacterium]